MSNRHVSELFKLPADVRAELAMALDRGIRVSSAQGAGGTSGSGDATSFGRSAVTTCQTMSSSTPR